MGGDKVIPLDAERIERLSQGKDELNLAEFPLSAIAERVDESQKTLVFEDRIWDESRAEMVTRQLTITASDEYGLPTALDDEVILGLVQLSKLTDFADRKVPFSRYQLLQILGWKNNSRNYERLETSLNRWLGVTLYYKNAWWDREEKSWVDEGFHIIDNFTLYDRERATRRRELGQDSLPLSTFTWNDVLFRSFRKGNLKSLDFDFYKRLDSSIAKRLYRFLDKRFYHRKSWQFDLKEVSWEHIGLSRNYDTANLKRKLLPAIQELERARFLTVLSIEERFQKVRSGEWRVNFERYSQSKSIAKSPANQEKQGLIDALLARQVTPSMAAQTVADYPSERITAQLEVFDWMMAQPEAKRPRNPPGYLIDSIKSEYKPPAQFVSRSVTVDRQAEAAERRKKEEEKTRAVEQREAAKRIAREEALLQFWQTQSDDEKKRLEDEALQSASAAQRQFIDKGGSLAKATRKMLLDTYALKVMQMAA